MSMTIFNVNPGGGGGTVDAANGTHIDTGTGKVYLGGPLVEATDVNLSGNNLVFDDSAHGSIVVGLTPSGATPRIVLLAHLTATTKESQIQMSESSLDLQIVDLAGHVQSITLQPTGILISDAIAGQGLFYDVDYSAADVNPRHIPDVGSVQALIAAASFYTSDGVLSGPRIVDLGHLDTDGLDFQDTVDNSIDVSIYPGTGAEFLVAVNAIGSTNHNNFRVKDNQIYIAFNNLNIINIDAAGIHATPIDYGAPIGFSPATALNLPTVQDIQDNCSTVLAKGDFIGSTNPSELLFDFTGAFPGFLVRVTAGINIDSHTSGTLTLTLAYMDFNGNPQTLVVGTLSAVGSAGFGPVTIFAQNSAGISLTATNSGTMSYSVVGSLESVP